MTATTFESRLAQVDDLACPLCEADHSGDAWEWLSHYCIDADGDTFTCSACQGSFVIRPLEREWWFQLEPLRPSYRDLETRNLDFIEQCARSFTDCVLTVELCTFDYKVTRLAEPGTRINSSRAIFTPDGIALQGDWTPSTPGNTSALGYGIGWFYEPKSPSYLCEKFYLERESADACRLIALQRAHHQAAAAYPGGLAGFLEMIQELERR